MLHAILLAFVRTLIYQKLQGIQVDGYAKRAAKLAACWHPEYFARVF